LTTGARAVDRRVPEITVLIDIDTFVHGLHDQSICETEEGVPVPTSTVRRLCCDADIGRAILNAKGRTVGLGSVAAHREPCPTTSTQGDVPHLRAPGLSGAVR
jgi:hypothetical protein